MSRSFQSLPRLAGLVAFALRRLTTPVASCIVTALTACVHSSSVPAAAITQAGTLRLVRAEEVIVPPRTAGWPRPLNVNDIPRYPSDARSAGIEGRVIVAFVIDEQGRVELPTLSIVEQPLQPEFARSVCTFLRNATFSWSPHPPARGLVLFQSVFALRGDAITQPLSPEPDEPRLHATLAAMSPRERAEWIESRPHCF